MLMHYHVDLIRAVVTECGDPLVECKAMAPVFERAAAEFEPDVRFLKVDTEAQPELAARYQIRSIPTLMLFRNGAVVAQRAGAVDTHTLRAWLQHVSPSEFQQT